MSRRVDFHRIFKAPFFHIRKHQQSFQIPYKHIQIWIYHQIVFWNQKSVGFFFDADNDTLARVQGRDTHFVPHTLLSNGSCNHGHRIHELWRSTPVQICSYSGKSINGWKHARIAVVWNALKAWNGKSAVDKPRRSALSYLRGHATFRQSISQHAEYNSRVFIKNSLGVHHFAPYIPCNTSTTTWCVVLHSSCYSLSAPLLYSHGSILANRSRALLVSHLWVSKKWWKASHLALR